MKTVILRAPVLTQSGYGVHSRQVARWLLSRTDLDVRFVPVPWGDTPWLLDRDAEDGLVGQVMQRATAPTAKADVAIHLQLPNEWDPSVGKVNVGITAAVETDRCHPSWIEACNRMTAVVVPSQHAKASLTNTATANNVVISTPILVVPEAYSGAIVAPQLPTLPTFSTPFNFLVFGQLTGNNAENDRKNTFYTIRWLCEAFKDDPEVGIVIKTNMGKHSIIDLNVTRGMLTSVVNESRRGSPTPKVHLLHGAMSDAEVAALYRHPQVGALVALTRGEGYGLPILEAAASGLPVIATNWSGHLDFMNRGKFISVYYQLNEIHPSRVDGKIFVKGARWASPSEADFKKRAQKFRKSSAVPKQWAAELAPVLRKEYSLSSIVSLYDDALRELF